MRCIFSRLDLLEQIDLIETINLPILKDQFKLSDKVIDKIILVDLPMCSIDSNSEISLDVPLNTINKSNLLFALPFKINNNSNFEISYYIKKQLKLRTVVIIKIDPCTLSIIHEYDDGEINYNYLKMV